MSERKSYDKMIVILNEAIEHAKESGVSVPMMYISGWMRSDYPEISYIIKAMYDMQFDCSK